MGDTKISVSELIAQAIMLVNMIIEKVVKQGRIPAWETFDLKIDSGD